MKAILINIRYGALFLALLIPMLSVSNNCPEELGEPLIDTEIRNGGATLDLCALDMDLDLSNVTFVYGNESLCEYKVFIRFTASGSCQPCNNSAGLIDANVSTSSFDYCPPLSGCGSGTVPCEISVLENGGTASAVDPDPCDAEYITGLGCSQGGSFRIAFYECAEIRIYAV